MAPDDDIRQILEQIHNDTMVMRQAVVLLTWVVVGMTALGVILAIASAG